RLLYYENPSVWLATDQRRCGLDLAVATRGNFDERHAIAGGGLGRLDQWRCVRRGVRVVDDTDAVHIGCDLAKELDPFAADRQVPDDETGHVAAGVHHALDQSEAYRIGDLCEHDGNRLCLFMNRPRSGQSLRVDEIGT